MSTNSKGLNQGQFVKGLNGSFSYLGTVSSTGTSVTNNGSFTIPLGKLVLVQPDAAGYLLPATSGSGTVSATNGLKLDPNEKWVVCLKSTEAVVAWISVSGTAALKVWSID